MTENAVLEQKAPMKFTSSLCVLKTEQILNYFRIWHVFWQILIQNYGENGEVAAKKKEDCSMCVSFMQT